jgi:hypothetical protein
MFRNSYLKLQHWRRCDEDVVRLYRQDAEMVVAQIHRWGEGLTLTPHFLFVGS